MRAYLWRRLGDDRGVLTFEWILLLTLLVIGIVGTLSGTRDAINDEFSDMMQAVTHLDQSYSVPPHTNACGTWPGFSFQDELPTFCQDRHPGTTYQTMGQADCSKDR